MADEPAVDAWVRGRFVSIPGARARRIRANAWTVQLPRTTEVARALRLRSVDLASVEDLVLSIDEVEASQAIPAAETDSYVEIAVLL